MSLWMAEIEHGQAVRRWPLRREIREFPYLSGGTLAAARFDASQVIIPTQRLSRFFR
jgi:hypothetical protein